MQELVQVPYVTQNMRRAARWLRILSYNFYTQCAKRRFSYPPQLSVQNVHDPPADYTPDRYDAEYIAQSDSVEFVLRSVERASYVLTRACLPYENDGTLSEAEVNAETARRNTREYSVSILQFRLYLNYFRFAAVVRPLAGGPSLTGGSRVAGGCSADTWP